MAKDSVDRRKNTRITQTTGASLEFLIESESAIGIIAVGSVVHVLDLAHMIDLPAFGLGLIIAGAVVLF
ncbi:hypothetical protein I4J07_11250, partial [Corynebacterium diphtheriae bv. gravis]|uniref:hypothetical protein n=1 Tax=Corynebacterium diphtheriae TaxID=1717 RepID=UPI0018CA6355